MTMHDYSPSIRGTLYLEGPQARYPFRGGCQQYDDGTADFWFMLNGGNKAYRGTIYEADDGEVYLEGTQDGTGIRILMQRY